MSGHYQHLVRVKNKLKTKYSCEALISANLYELFIYYFTDIRLTTSVIGCCECVMARKLACNIFCPYFWNLRPTSLCVIACTLRCFASLVGFSFIQMWLFRHFDFEAKGMSGTNLEVEAFGLQSQKSEIDGDLAMGHRWVQVLPFLASILTQRRSEPAPRATRLMNQKFWN